MYISQELSKASYYLQSIILNLPWMVKKPYNTNYKKRQNLDVDSMINRRGAIKNIAF